MTAIRRAMSWVPLAPVALICVGAGIDAVVRDLNARAMRAFDDVLREVEANTRRWVP